MIQSNYFLVEDNKTSSYVERTSAGDYFIHNSEFNSLINRAICISSNSYQTRLLSQESRFTKCSYSSYQGGSIYFGTKGSCALVKVCATESKNSGRDNGGVFSYQIVSQDASTINLIDLSTIFNCGVIGDGNNMIEFINGNVTLSNTNESQNLTPVDPFYEIINATTTEIKYCEFENASHAVYHTLAYVSSPGILKSCNVVNCKVSDVQGIFYVGKTSISLTNCAILQHECNVYFYICESSSVTLINCAIDCGPTGFSTCNSPSNKYNTNQIGKSSFLNQLSLLDFQICLKDDFYEVHSKICITNMFINFGCMPSFYVFTLICMYSL